MKGSLGTVLASLALAAVALLAPSPVAANGGLGQPRATPLGTFGGIAYVQYDGIFAGQTSTGAYRVPYRITAPADPAHGNGTVLVEPSHFAIGLGTLNVYLRRDFLFARRFAHAGIAWSTINQRILDPTVPGTFIDGGFEEFGGKTDEESIGDFARALAVDGNARARTSCRATAGCSMARRRPRVRSSRQLTTCSSTVMRTAMRSPWTRVGGAWRASRSSSSERHGTSRASGAATMA